MIPRPHERYGVRSGCGRDVADMLRGLELLATIIGAALFWLGYCIPMPRRGTMHAPQGSKDP
jgi:hypothetical protein